MPSLIALYIVFPVFIAQHFTIYVMLLLLIGQGYWSIQAVVYSRINSCQGYAYFILSTLTHTVMGAGSHLRSFLACNTWVVIVSRKWMILFIDLNIIKNPFTCGLMNDIWQYNMSLILMSLVQKLSCISWNCFNTLVLVYTHAKYGLFGSIVRTNRWLSKS